MTNQTPESVIDDSVVEAAYRAFCEARFGKALSDDEHDALRSRLELTWMKPTIAAALRAANMLREPGKPDAATAATAAIERVTAERDAAMARIAKAWELHEPFIWSFGHGPVQSCKWCADHGVSQEVASWPCPTIQALEDVSNDQNLINPHNHAEIW